MTQLVLSVVTYPPSEAPLYLQDPTAEAFYEGRVSDLVAKNVEVEKKGLC